MRLYQRFPAKSPSLVSGYHSLLRGAVQSLTSTLAHWLAVEGVQPSIPQNPTAADSRNLELVSKGPNANSTLAAISGTGDVAVKPLVKHVLSRELQLYFEKVCSAFLHETSEDYRTSGYSSLREDPGLHQLVPYFVQFIAEKVTHSLKNVFVLTQVMHMAEALVQNQSLYVDPYVSRPCDLWRTCSNANRIPDRLSCTINSYLPHRPTAWWNCGSRGVIRSARYGRLSPQPYCQKILPFLSHAQASARALLSQDLPRPFKAIRCSLWCRDWPSICRRL